MSKKRTVKRVKKGINPNKPSQRTKRECDEMLLDMLLEEKLFEEMLLQDMLLSLVRLEVHKQYYKK